MGKSKKQRVNRLHDKRRALRAFALSVGHDFYADGKAPKNDAMFSKCEELLDLPEWEGTQADRLIRIFNCVPQQFRPHLWSKKSTNAKQGKIEAKRLREEKKRARQDFYEGRAWKDLRYRILVEHGGACQACGRTAAHGVVIHVDHIKPRSKYPALELDPDNLQVLCADCNLGKSNKDETDWRKPKADAENSNEETHIHR